MDQFDRDVEELGDEVARALHRENSWWSRNERVQQVAWHAEEARFKAESRRIWSTDYGFGD